MMERKTISIMKACELVGVSRRTIYNWIASGKVEYVRTAGGSVRIFVDTLWREPGRRRRADPQRSLMMPAARRSHPRGSVDETQRSGTAVPSAEQPARDHPRQRRAARGEVADEMARARAAQVVASVLDAMTTAREIRLRSRLAIRSQTPPVRALPGQTRIRRFVNCQRFGITMPSGCQRFDDRSPTSGFHTPARSKSRN